MQKSGTQWTEREREFVRTNWGTLTRRMIAKKLKKALSSVNRLAIAQDGKVASQGFTVGGANPNPPNPPNPPPDPTPGKISAALVLNPDKLQTQSPQQAAAWIDGGAAAYMAKAAYRWRQIVSDSLDESGKSPAAELFFLQAAAKSGKSYPVLVIGKSGSAEILYAETCPDIDTRNKALQRYGGPGEFPQLAPVDWSKVPVDIGNPALDEKSRLSAHPPR